METETCRNIRSKIEDKMAMILHCHGFPGSGKSQIIRKMAGEFPFAQTNDFFILWHIQCKDSGHDLKKELNNLAKRILQSLHKMNQETYQNIVDNLNINEASELVKHLVEINVDVAIIVEDPLRKDRDELLLKSLCRNLNDHSERLTTKFHVYISSREKKPILHDQDMSCYHLEEVKGFNNKEAIKYLEGGITDKQEAAVISDKQKAAEDRIVARFGGLPLGLQVARGYCQKVRITYTDYLDLVEDLDYDIIKEEEKETLKEYGESAPHVFQAIVMPFVTRNDKDDTTTVLQWKILCCISYFHYDRIPRYVLEQCCHLLREGKVKKPQLQNKVDIGRLITELLEHNMCTETDEGEITFHEVVLNAFRLNKHSVLTDHFNPLEKATEIICSLVSKDMRKKDHATKMHKLRRHLQSLLCHLEKNAWFDSSNDKVLFKALISHLHETVAAIMLNESPSFRTEAEKHLQQSLEQLWPEMCRYSDSDLMTCDKSDEKIAQDIVQHSISKASELPADLTVKYASKLEFIFDDAELEFLKKRSQCATSFKKVKKSLDEKDDIKNLVKDLHSCGLFLSDEKYKPIFYAERFAAILHTWSRLVLYSDPEEVKEEKSKCLRMSNLSHRVGQECKTNCGVSLLTEHISKTGGWVPIVLKLKESREYLNKALDICQNAMHNPPRGDMFENGMLKELNGPSHNYTRITLLKHIARINARLHKGAGPDVIFEADKRCKELFDLSLEHVKTISQCLMCLVYCAKYYAAKEEFERALEIFQKYFELESECKSRFNVQCWATFNYARVASEHKICSTEVKREAFEKCTKVLRSKDGVISKRLTDGLNGYLKALNSCFATGL